MKNKIKSRGLYLSSNNGSHFALLSLWVLVIAIIVFYIRSSFKTGFNIQSFICTAFMTGVIFLLIIYKKRSGIYFMDDKVYFCNGIFTKTYDIMSIAGIKKVVSECYDTFGQWYVCKDSNGNPEFTVFYLSKVDESIRNFDNKKMYSRNFTGKYSEFILFSSVYDERVIQYLKAVNPDIEIMD